VVALTAVGTLGTAACDRGPSRLELIDLVAEDSFAFGGERLEAGESFAADETWVAVQLEPGRRVAALVELHSKPVLDLAGAVVCGDTAAANERLSLVVDVGEHRQDRLNLEHPIVRAGEWWSRSFDLSGRGGRRVELGLEARLPAGCSLLLSEATIRQTKASSPRSAEVPPQVLVISVDTLRKDAVGAFGGSVATPHLDRLAAQGQTWTRHYAAATWTKPSHASMLTGYHVDTHRALQINSSMDPAIPTLAERFQGGGMTTAALVYDCGWLSRKWGFGKGFDSYRLTQWRARRQAVAAVDWVQRHRNEPFFFFVHTFEPHSDAKMLPYEAPGISRQSIAEEFGVDDFGHRDGLRASRFLIALGRGEIPRQPGDVEILRATYDAGVRYLDASLGVLFDALRESGVWDHLLVVVTSDHGEEFDEHGGFEHGSLYEEIIAVPLIIKWPNSERAGSSSDVLSSSVDLAPTLLGYAGLPTDDLPGTDLRARSNDDPVFAGTTKRAVIAGNLKASFDHTGALWLFDLAADPGEQRNLLDADPRAADKLRQMLREQRRQAKELHRRLGSQQEPTDVALSERERQRLRAFGYIE
jgi:arylsulfatase A-like enzyme